MKFNLTLADLALVDDETGEEICLLTELIPDENQCICDGLEMYVKERQHEFHRKMTTRMDKMKLMIAEMAKEETL